MIKRIFNNAQLGKVFHSSRLSERNIQVLNGLKAGITLGNEKLIQYSSLKFSEEYLEGKANIEAKALPDEKALVTRTSYSKFAPGKSKEEIWEIDTQKREIISHEVNTYFNSEIINQKKLMKWLSKFISTKHLSDILRNLRYISGN